MGKPRSTPPLPSRTDGHVSGAGPTGLTLAASLRRLGVDHILIDRNDAIRSGSRAAADSRAPWNTWTGSASDPVWSKKAGREPGSACTTANARCCGLAQHGPPLRRDRLPRPCTRAALRARRRAPREHRHGERSGGGGLRGADVLPLWGRTAAPVAARRRRVPPRRSGPRRFGRARRPVRRGPARPARHTGRHETRPSLVDGDRPHPRLHRAARHHGPVAPRNPRRPPRPAASGVTP
ncbi:hypothetical protein CP968_01625 [Streptomyces subrutilus]|uniref:FAD-binding domain-containing protein n=1 Tax=Streptomyces subrutilus TaxID=36818 RepID=A0A5P2UHB8_9ACTN|nr:hypothetical protein CP968_01625 [Streptomyces subrutilus]